MKPRKTLQTMRTIDRIFLYMGFELSSNEWRMAFSTGLGERIVMRRCKAGDMGELAEVILAVKEEFGIGELAGIRSVYEAGFDAFWLHNTLTELGVANVIVDAASIEVNQRGRRRKTDRLDARQLVRKLIQYDLGDLEVWSVCHVPSRADEDDRRIERERQRLTEERTAHRNRLWGLLRARGIESKVNNDLFENLDEMTCADGTPLGFHEKQELRREYRRFKLVSDQIKELETELESRVDHADVKSEMARKLTRIKGIGLRLAWGLVAELFGWRNFRRRDDLSSYVGYDSAPYDTGLSTGRSQGISKAGNRWVRAIMHSVAINWIRWQPDSHLVQWYRHKYEEASAGERRKGRVALARKILVRLWRWVEFDEPPWGAALEPAGV